jgi:hypothetical protein
MTRINKLSDNELKQLLDTELERFRELDNQKQDAWRNVPETMTIQEWELLKQKWQDSADEIKHLHRKLYPYFPRSGVCSNCGCDMLPMAGGRDPMEKCIACGQHSDRWRF